MANHLSAIKAKLSLYGISVHMFQDPRIKYFQKAMTLHKPFKVQLKKIIDINTLQLMVQTCDSTYMGQVFKAIYTMAFFSFLRLSNFVPHSAHAFYPLYHLARGDIIFAKPGMHVLIKWSKTIQTRNTVKILKIPFLGANPICPVTAVKNLLAITPGCKNDQLFQYKTLKGWVPLTDIPVRRHFHLIKKLSTDQSCSIPKVRDVVSNNKTSIATDKHSPSRKVLPKSESRSGLHRGTAKLKK